MEELHQARLQSVTLPEAARCLGKRLDALALPALGVNVLSVRRAGGGVFEPEPDHVLAAGDTLVVAGQPEALALAEARLLRN